VGYAVKGKKATYYKCNRNGCKCNRNATIMHEGFKEFVSTYTIPEKYVEPLKAQLTLTFNSQNSGNHDQKAQLSKRLNEVQKNIDTVEERFALGLIGEDVYKKVRGKYQDEYAIIDSEYRSVDRRVSNLSNFVNYSVKLSSKLNTMWSSGDFSLKQGLQNLLFPEGVTYDYEKAEYRTCRSNGVFVAIAHQARVWGENENGGSGFYAASPASVVWGGVEPPTHGFSVHCSTN
jgi:site-specific DNA recombinase